MSLEEKINSIRCDLHIHSALSPCAEDEMSPGNIVGMAKLNELDVIAVTDHQRCGNCAAAIHISEKIDGPLVIPGMEAESAEEIHLLCLFADLDTAYKFERIIVSSQIVQSNRPEIFGNQYYYDSSDNIIGSEKNLLIMPSSYSCDELAAAVFSLGGACLPAHVDRQANSMLTTLGTIPEDFPGTWIEFSKNSNPEEFFDRRPELRKYRWLKDSDAHRLENILDPGWPIRLPGFTKDDKGRKLLIDRLREK